MDAIALSLGNAENAASIATSLAARGIIIGAIANTLFKTVMGFWLGHRQLRMPLLAGMIPMILAGGLSLAWMFML
jgi:uncharacterized membrane protein (DUF4010 family)